MAKKIKEIQKVGYKVVILVSSVPYDQKQPRGGTECSQQILKL